MGTEKLKLTFTALCKAVNLFPFLLLIQLSKTNKTNLHQKNVF